MAQISTLFKDDEFEDDELEHQGPAAERRDAPAHGERSAQPASRGRREPRALRAQALCSYGDQLAAAWTGGVIAPARQSLSTFDGARWTSRPPVPGASSIGPRLAAVGGALFAAWRSEPRHLLSFARFDGDRWTPPATIPGATSCVGPALAGVEDRLHAAWRGPRDDEAVRHACFDGRRWSRPALIPGAASSIGPALAGFGDGLFAAWKGRGDDRTIWYSSSTGAPGRSRAAGTPRTAGVGSVWTPPTRLPEAESEVEPCLTTYRGRLYAAWKGAGRDERLWWTSFDGNHWAAPTTILGAASGLGPALAVGNDRLYAMWAGMGRDRRLWCAAFSGSIWSDPACIPGSSGRRSA